MQDYLCLPRKKKLDVLIYAYPSKYFLDTRLYLPTQKKIWIQDYLCLDRKNIFWRQNSDLKYLKAMCLYKRIIISEQNCRMCCGPVDLQIAYYLAPTQRFNNNIYGNFRVKMKYHNLQKLYWNVCCRFFRVEGNK